MKPGDYKVPSKDANNLSKFLFPLLLTMLQIVEYELMNKPELFAYTRRAQVDPAATESMLSKAGSAQLGNTTAHWKTNSQQTNES